MITSDKTIESLLKVKYRKEGPANLMFKNDPLLKEVKKENVEGKSYNFSAIYSRGGAVSSKYLTAKKAANENVKAAEFAVEPGELYSVCNYTNKEVAASKTNEGAYMSIAGAKFFASTEAFRKTLAATMYGRGYGEICKLNYTTAITANTEFDVVLPSSALQVIDIGSMLVIKPAVDSATVSAHLTVTAIDDSTNTVTFTSDTAVTPNATDILAFDGCMDASGAPLAPMGLAGWLPTVGKRADATWKAYIKTPFMGLDRSAAPSRLAGNFVDGTGDADKIKTLMKALKIVSRKVGDSADVRIVLNDNDYEDVVNTIEKGSTYFSNMEKTGKKAANVGIASDNITLAFARNWFDKLVVAPACPAGKFYVLDMNSIQYNCYFSDKAVSDSLENDKPDPMAENATPVANYSPLIDNFISAIPSESDAGIGTTIALNFLGALVITDTSNCSVGLFDGADVIE
jgi:hypothetical protein